MSNEMGGRRILMLCDWLPPDFGAVGQYALAFASESAQAGQLVTLVGFSSQAAAETHERLGAGELTIRRIHRPAYDRGAWLKRAVWTLVANVALLWGARRELRAADEIRFTGSPPYLLHFVMPVARLFRRRTRYRITDFHPECLIAALARAPWWLRALQRLTNFWRRRVDVIEVLGEDQRVRLRDSGIPDKRIVLRRDPSPVEFSAATPTAALPAEIAGKRAILYSGNWGIAHDHETFVEGFARFDALHPGVAAVWLNATGGRADTVEAALRARGLPHVRTRPVPLAELPGVLRAAYVHLITLTDAFVGYVLPSKVYACAASGRPVLFVGSAASDVDLVCRERMAASQYRRAAVGDASAVVDALAHLLGLAVVTTAHNSSTALSETGEIP